MKLDQANTIRFGSTLVDSIYVGSTKMWPKYDTSAASIFNFWDSQGSSPSGELKTLVNDTVVALKDSAIWQEVDILSFLNGITSVQTRTNWKNPTTGGLFSVVGTPVFTARGGWKGDGIDDRLDSTFIPATSNGNWIVNSASVWSYSSTNLASSLPDCGAGVSYAAYCIPCGDTSQMGGIINRVSGATSTAPMETSIGLTGIQRIDANTERLWKDGIQQGSDFTVAAAGRPTGAFCVLGRTPSVYSARAVDFTACGSSLSGKEADLYLIVTDYLTAIANVDA